MRKLISAVMIILILLAALSGCQDDAQSSNVPEATTAAETTSPNDVKFDPASLHTFDKNSDDPFAGVWQITDGSGSQFEDFRYLFDGDGGAVLFTGNTGYTAKYSTGTDKDGEATITAQMMFGINGEYIYEFNKSKDTAELSDPNSGQSLTIKKVENYSPLPTSDKNPVIDEKVLGAWKSEDGEYYYFGDDGIMYQNLYNTMFTYAVYSVKNGEITAQYSSGADEGKSDSALSTDTYTYTADGDTLTLNGYEYSRIDTSELM